MSDLSERLLCIDKTCTGTINDRGYCNVCGKSFDGEYDPLRADPEVDVKSQSGLTQVQLECERLLTERLAQVGSRISNRTVGFVASPAFWESSLKPLSSPGQTSKTSMYITGTIEGADIEFWIYEAGGNLHLSHGSQEFWQPGGFSLIGLPEEFVDAVLEALEEVNARINPEVLEPLNEKKISVLLRPSSRWWKFVKRLF